MLISVDPGKGGAYAVFTDNGQLLETHKVKVPSKQRFFSLNELNNIYYTVNHYKDISYTDSVTVVMEEFLDHRMPNQSPKATNTTACNHGMQQATALLAGAEVKLVRPSEWKKGMGLWKQDKNASVELARTLVDPSFLRKPRMRVDNVDIAEAILIGIYWGRKHLLWEI